MDILIAAAVALGILLVLDALWLKFIAAPLYRRYLSKFIRETLNMYAAVAFYVIYAAGVVFLVVQPAESLVMSAVMGAALGFVAYATFCLTNAAVFKGFSWKLIVSDLAWGAFVTAVAATTAYYSLDLVSL